MGGYGTKSTALSLSIPHSAGQQQLGKRCAVFQTLPSLYHSLERRLQRVTLSYLSN